MVSWIRAVLTVALVCGAASGAARGEASLPSGEEIMRRVDARPRGKNQTTRAISISLLPTARSGCVEGDRSHRAVCRP